MEPQLTKDEIKKSLKEIYIASKKFYSKSNFPEIKNMTLKEINNIRDFWLKHGWALSELEENIPTKEDNSPIER